MTESIKAVIFDFDLTLADSREGIIRCFRHSLETFGYPVPDDEAICRTIGLPLIDGFDILTNMERNPQREDMKRVYVKKADEVMSPCTYFYPDTREVLRGLRDKGIRVGIVSSKMRYRIEETFDLKLKERPYDRILGLDDVEKPKPDPEGILTMARLMGLELSQILYVGDSYIDAQTGANAGVSFAGVTTGSTTREELEKYPNVGIFDSLGQLYEALFCQI